jgi:hypothetical protein
MNPRNANSLCLECGLCCNGVIFANVQLQPGDNAARLKSLGLAISNPTSKTGAQKFNQPCTAFDGCRCEIYSDRPKYCRQFECLLLKSVKAGDTSLPEASKVIRSALRRVKKVKSLLRELGDTGEHVALSNRFRQMQRTFENGSLDGETAAKFGELTLAVHDLNILLSESFYYP